MHSCGSSCHFLYRHLRYRSWRLTFMFAFAYRTTQWCIHPLNDALSRRTLTSVPTRSCVGSAYRQDLMLFNCLVLWHLHWCLWEQSQPCDGTRPDECYPLMWSHHSKMLQTRTRDCFTRTDLQQLWDCSRAAPAVFFTNMGPYTEAEKILITRGKLFV